MQSRFEAKGPDRRLDGAARACSRARRRVTVALCAIVMVVALATVLAAGAGAEQASQPQLPAAGQIDVSGGGDASGHTCAVLADANVRCWGFGGAGRLGYASTNTIGDDEPPGSVGPVNLGLGRTATAISAGAFHTCALLDDQSVRCWGFGGDGRLGYADTTTIGDDEPPGSAGPVDLGRPAVAISAGGAHTCAILDDKTVRCWGWGSDGRLGYANRNNIGDNEAPGSAGPVDLGPGRTAKAISAGQSNSCALLDDGSVRCWGFGGNGQLGYPSPNNNTVGDDETPGSAGPVDLGPGRTATAISAGAGHACALLDDQSVRCWGFGGNGRLGYANTTTIGDDETPGSVGPVNLGPGRTATAISVGDGHTCARLDDSSVRCWGYGADGRLGYANTNDIGDNETPGSAGPVNLGPGRTALAISAGGAHTSARLDDQSVRSWGYGANGRLGYCNTRTIGDDETPGSAGPVALGAPGGVGARCAVAGAAPPAPPGAGGATLDPLEAEAARRRGLSSCLARVIRHARGEIRRARRLSRTRQASARRHAGRHRRQLRRRCLKRWGRTPGRVTGLKARALSSRTIVLSFNAPGSDGSRPPAARSYLVKQSRRPIRGARGFRRAQTLCMGSCRFPTARVGAEVTLRVTDLRPRTTYHYAVAARDNVSRRLGRRSRSARVRTR